MNGKQAIFVPVCWANQMIFSTLSSTHSTKEDNLCRKRMNFHLPLHCLVESGTPQSLSGKQYHSRSFSECKSKCKQMNIMSSANSLSLHQAADRLITIGAGNMVFLPVKLSFHTSNKATTHSPFLSSSNSHCPHDVVCCDLPAENLRESLPRSPSPTLVIHSSFGTLLLSFRCYVVLIPGFYTFLNCFPDFSARF